jgi:hypothetical protein
VPAERKDAYAARAGRLASNNVMDLPLRVDLTPENGG